MQDESQQSPVGSETVGAGERPYLPLSSYEGAIFDLRTSVSLLSESVGDIETSIGFDSSAEELLPVGQRLRAMEDRIDTMEGQVLALKEGIDGLTALVQQAGRIVTQLNTTLAKHRHDSDGAAIMPLQP